MPDGVRRGVPPWVAVVAALAVGAGAVACGDAPARSDSDPIRIGAIYAQSGVYGGIGSETLDGVRFAVDEINAQGGIHGRQVELEVKDYRSDPSQLVGIANQLVRDGVVAIIGPETSTSAVVLDPIMASAKVPLLSGAGLDPKGAYSFSAQPLSGYFTLSAQFAKSSGAKSLCDLGISGASFDSLKAVLEPAAQAIGLPMGTQIPFDASATSLTPQVTQLKSDGCTAIFAGGTGSSLLVVARAMVDLGMTEHVLMTQPTNATATTLEQLGPAAPFTHFALAKVTVPQLLDPADPALATITPFVDAWRAANKPALTTNNAIGYSSAQVILSSVRDGGPSAEQVYQHLTSGAQFPTPLMTMSFRDHHNGSLPDKGEGWFLFAHWNPATKAFELSYSGAG